jgi:hypothetical protein
MENSGIGNSGFYIVANHLHKNARVLIYAGKEWMNRCVCVCVVCVCVVLCVCVVCVCVVCDGTHAHAHTHTCI